MKLLKTLCIAGLAAGGTALSLSPLAMADGYDEYTELSAPKARTIRKVETVEVEKAPARRVRIVETESSMARSLGEVGAISLQGSMCDADLAQELDDRGIVVASGGNAVLDVDIATNGRLSDPDSVENGAYTATLRGANGRTLFSTAGREESHDLAALCEDIGEEVADELEDRLG